MVAMQQFVTWFLTELPDFLMSEPICYLWGLVLLGYIIRIFVINLRRF